MDFFPTQKHASGLRCVCVVTYRVYHSFRMGAYDVFVRCIFTTRERLGQLCSYVLVDCGLILPRYWCAYKKNIRGITVVKTTRLHRTIILNLIYALEHRFQLEYESIHMVLTQPSVIIAPFTLCQKRLWSFVGQG